MAIIQPHPKLRAWQGFNDRAFYLNLIFFFRHSHLLKSPKRTENRLAATQLAASYSIVLLYWRRFIRRMAFFFSTRRSSLLLINQRLRRTVLRTPLFTTFLRKRFSS